MRISAISENMAHDDRFTPEHGLSIHIDLGDSQILFDTGASSNFVQNAAIMGIDLDKVDYAVISHGHDDHGGGLGVFLDVNRHAKVYVMRKAFGAYCSQKSPILIKSIALDSTYAHSDRVVLLDGDTDLADGVRTMSGIRHTYPMPLSNGNLLVDSGTGYVHDTFDHEQDLVVKGEDGYILFVGCAHNGIKNILEHFKSLYGEMPKVVFGGFHLCSRTCTCETDAEIDALGEYLLTTGAHFYTCHCTGLDAYIRLHDIMGDKIDYFSTGCAVDIK